MLEMGRQIDRYTLEAPIGAGGQGFVYRVRHNQLGTEHALKVVTGGGARVRERLLQEGRAQARLRHPNIVSVTDVLDVDGDSGLIMEFIQGPPLSRLIAENELDLGQIDVLVAGLLEGVSHAHSQHFVHRDLKPDNVLCALTSRGVVPKIMDFGLVKALAGAEVPSSGMRQTRTGAMMGTAQYMSPEQVRSTRDVDARSDVWALGAVLYELVTRALAFDGEDLYEVIAAVVKGEYRPVQELRDGVPERMVRAIDGALTVDLDKRVQSVEALRAMWFEGVTEPRPGAAAWDDTVIEEYKVSRRPSSQPSAEHETWAGSLDFDSEEGSLSPPTAATTETRDRRLPFGLLLVGLSLGMVGAAGMGLAAWQLNGDSPEVEPTAVVEPAAVPDPDPAPQPSPIEPPPAVAKAEVEAAAPSPAPVPIAPRPAQPSPVPVPKPPPSAEAEVQPSPSPVVVTQPAPPEPKPKSKPTGTFTVRGADGDGVKVYLAPEDGGRYIHPGQAVGPGRYTLVFKVQGESSKPQEVEVGPGESVSAICDAASVFCRIR